MYLYINVSFVKKITLFLFFSTWVTSVVLQRLSNEENNCFEVYWNVPSQQCRGKGILFQNISEFGIKINTNDSFLGDQITIFYDAGIFPSIAHLSNNTVENINGGVPQAGDLKVHLEKFYNDVNSIIPNKDFDGLAVIDFEAWRPVYRQNFGTLTEYRTLSEKIEREKNPNAPENEIIAEAKKNFEQAAQLFFEETLKLGQKMRPHGTWGYYGFPPCYNMNGNNQTYCPEPVPDENDQIIWLYENNDAMYPSLYLRKGGWSPDYAQRLIEGRITEAKRIAENTVANPKIYTYFSLKYRDNMEFLPEKELYDSLNQMKRMGINGVVIWGSSSDVNNKENCLSLQRYTNSVLGPIVQDLCSISNIDGAEYSCNKTQIRKVISGVVGAASSVTSIQVANLLRLFKIPQVSFFSTSPELSNKQRFEFFSRTIPSDHYQVKAMVDIVQKMGWSYVSIIYEESNYGIKAFEELEELLSKNDICIAVKEKLVKDSGVAEEIAYDNIVQKLLTKSWARGAIIFGSDQEVAGVMRAVRRNNATGSFSWIGSDGWSARSLVSNGNEAEVEGTLSVQPQANSVQGFHEYFLDLTVENNRRNPWFVEFWEDHFKCRYPNSSWTPYNQKYTRMCTTKEKLTKQNTVFEDQLQFVSDAVMAFAYAIKDMHKDLCHGKPGLCEAMKPTKGTDLLKYLRTVNFQGLTGDHFHFDGNGDGPARYNIIHFKQVSPGKYQWIRVGEYVEGELRLNMSEIQFKLGHPKPPESVCSLPCNLGQAKKYVEGESCCWHCFNCTQYQVRHPLDETQCMQCSLGTVPDIHHVRCMEIPEVYLRPDSGWAIGAMALSTSGVLATMFVLGVFIRYNDTPVVRASGRELSYVLLAGILMCYCVTYALVLRPTDLVCGVQRFGAGFCFTVVYAALFTKTNRIARIFNAGKHTAKRPSFISPKSQLIICMGMVFIQVLINGVWMLLSPARAIHHYPTREDNLLVCSSYIDASYMIAFTYPIFLIIVCTVYAILTRKIPEAFNESKFIGFTMYTTCVIWLAFVPLYFGTANHVALRITSMSVTISLSASVTVICLFSPKLYIILIRPERNVRQSMMPVRYSVVNNRTVTSNSGAGSMMAAVVVTAATCDQKEKIDKHVPPISQNSLEHEKKEKVDKSTQTNTILHARIMEPPVKVTNSTSLTNDSVAKINSASSAAVLVANNALSAPNMTNNSSKETIGNGPLITQNNQINKEVAL